MEKDVVLEQKPCKAYEIAKNIQRHSNTVPGIQLAENVFTYTLSPERITQCNQIIQEDRLIPSYWKDKYEKEIVKNWDKFYKENTTNFFKDRMWIKHEFPELQCPKIISSQTTREDFADAPTNHHKAGQPFLIDVGCGVGNALIPILKCCPHLYAAALDCSPRAIQLLNKRWSEVCLSMESKATSCCEEKIGHLVTTLSFDILSGHIPTTLYPSGGADFVLLLFVLSALPSSQFLVVCSRIKKCLRPGGILFFRDYAQYDMTQLRFAQSKRALVSPNCYVRQDGTLTYYFTTEEIFDLFSKQLGLDCVENIYIQKQINNRKTGREMKRIWIQAKFRYPGPPNN